MKTLLPEHVDFYNENGFVIVRGLFSTREAEHLREHFMQLRAQGPRPGDFAGSTSLSSNDPLLKYPRMIHMHRWDPISREWLLDRRLNEVLTGLLGSEPYGVQTMLYFKPPGARGQAMHQDQHYLRAKPGTCMAAWMALDDTDESNGCMMLVPGSHRWPLMCTAAADTTASFTDEAVPLPAGVEPVAARMKAGDVLFFHGATVHGSHPNTTTDRFRRSLIAHYVEQQCTHLSKFDQPLVRMDGTDFTIDDSPRGGPCGRWVDTNGQPILEMVREGSTMLKDHE
jgi:phytanoyl-CoA hydroxylase